MKIMSNKKICFIVLFISSLVIIIGGSLKILGLNYLNDDNVLYVSLDGNDSNLGTLNSPFLTLEKALKAATNNTTIYIREGTYVFAKNIEIKEKNNIIISPYNNEKVVFTTAHKLPLTDYKCDSSRSDNENIICIDLNKYLNDTDNHDPALKYYLNSYGKNEFINNFIKINGIKLYYNDERLNVARYPNNNMYLTIDSVSKVSETENALENKKTNFSVNNILDRGWIDLESNESLGENIYVHGYYTYDFHAWYDKVNIKADSINNAVNVTLIDTKATSTIKTGQRIAFYNIFQELDYEKEYYFDENTNQLYLYNEFDEKDQDFIEYTFNFTTSGLINRKSLFYLHGSNNITFQNIKFDKILNNVIYGTPLYNENKTEFIKTLANILIKNSEFKNIGGKSVYLVNSEECAIQNNDFVNIADNAIHFDTNKIYISKLKPQNNLILNNKITNYDTDDLLNYAIGLDGVNNRIAHNEISNSGARGIRFSGNGHIIEFNEIYNVCEKNGDAGAIYSGRSLTSSGTIIQNNYLHDIYVKIDRYILEEERIPGKTYSAVFGVYTDDLETNVTVKNNVFYNVNNAYNVNGGNYNKFINNLLIHSTRGVSYMPPSSKVHTTITDSINSIINSQYYDPDAWQEKYPLIKAELLDKVIEIRDKYKSEDSGTINTYINSFLKDYVSSTRGMIIENNLVLGDEGISISGCEDILKTDSSGPLKVPKGLALNTFRIENNFNEATGEDFLGHYTYDNNNFKIDGGVCTYNKNKKIYYGLQDGYTTDKKIVEDYDNGNFNLNLEYIRANYLNDFEEIHFNRIGRNKVIKLEIAKANFKNAYIPKTTNLDFSKGYLNVYYSSGVIKRIPMKKAKISGTGNLTLNYKGEKININIKMVKKYFSKNS